MRKSCVRILFAVLLMLIMVADGSLAASPSGVSDTGEVIYDRPYYKDILASKQWALEAININNCWKYYTTGSKDVNVCVIDSGFWYGHKDAQKNFTPGKDYYTGLTNTSDIASHGTSCAGIIGATSGNNEGISGLCKNVNVICLCVNDAEHNTPAKVEPDILAEAIRDSVDVYDADVISMSIPIEKGSDALKEACDYAVNQGVIVVAAAGNYGVMDSRLCYPASYDSVIGVGAVSADLSCWVNSSRNKSVFCCAPGQSVYTLRNIYCSNVKEKYEPVSGTSLATPHVAGLAALVRSVDDSVDSAAFQKLLKKSCKDLGSKGYDTAYGWGLIDCEKTLKVLFDEKDGNVFTDVSKKNWFYSAVLDVYKNGLMVGVGENSFGPGVPMTRSMFVTVLYRMSGSPSVSVGNEFKDVVKNSYYEKAVYWAKENKIAYGIGDGLFAPVQSLSRQEMVTMLYRYYKDYLKVIIPDKGGSATFNDWNTVASWAVDAASVMTKAGVISGCLNDNGTISFAPNRVATRAEAAKVISGLRLLFDTPKEETDPEREPLAEILDEPVNGEEEQFIID